MAQIEITRTELVWPGKYDDDGRRAASPRIALPFQTIESVNEGRATREDRKRPEQRTLFDVWSGDEGETFEDGWRNKLIWGDNLLVLAALLDKMASKVDLIYIDPPFATGADFAYQVPIGDSDVEAAKDQSIIEEKAYRDTWGRGGGSFLSMISSRLELGRDLLSDGGSIYVHMDARLGPAVKHLLDEIFGSSNFRNEVIWYYSGGGASKELWARKHDNIYFYSKGPRWTFNVDAVRQPYKWTEGQRRADGSGRDLDMGKIPDDVFDLHGVMPWASERTFYPTQKPEALLERIIAASSNPGDLVADFFVGSGTTAAVAEKLGRRWIACDLGRFAIHTTRKRLMDIEGCKPFEVLNLGKYERQYWQSTSFGERDAQRVLFEYIAFMLRLYGAEPLAGLQHLHGKRGGAVIHVGAVDAPVTIAEVTDALDECVATGQRELHVLGWEWEMGLNDLVKQLGVDRGIDLKLRQVPREVMETQAVEKGDIRFFELAYLDCKVETGAKRATTVELTDFAMSDADAIDPEVRAKIMKWSDFVDYWAIDFDFQNDTFINGWVAYRTRKERRLTLRSDPHTYAGPGAYNVAVKVVDIFGNDTTRIFPVEVR